MRPYRFTPGPSELYFTAERHAMDAFREGVPSLSHRSKAFEGIYAEAAEGVRALLGAPRDWHVVFTSSATEIWERLLQNCVERQSFHLVNGAFSRRFFAFAGELGLEGHKAEVPFGEGFDLGAVDVPQDAELLAVTQNETSAGAWFPTEDIAELRKRYPDTLIAVDAVSSVPHPQFDFSQFDSLYFSVQKGMGLPAGLGVWLFNERLADKAEKKLASGRSVGTYHSVPSLLAKAAKHQTPCTPNVLGLYLLGKVANDMLDAGLERLRAETEQKAAFVYGFYERAAWLQPLVKEARHRSKTVLVADVLGGVSSQQVVEALQAKGLTIGRGYGAYKPKQIRIANFPTHSKERMFQLLDYMEALAWEGVSG